MKWMPSLTFWLLSSLLMVAAGAGGAWWLLAHGIVHVPLHDQPMAVRLPDNLPVQVEVLQVRAADGGLSSGLPVRLNETLHLDVELDTEVPLELIVRYQGEIPVQTAVPVDTTMQTKVFGAPLELPVKGSIPLDLNLPVDLTIPIRQPVRLKFSAPITAHVDQTVNIPLSGTLDTRVRFDGTPISLHVSDSELALPLDRVWLSEGDGGWRIGPLASEP